MSANLFALLQSGFPQNRAQPCFLLESGEAVSYGALEEGAGRFAAWMKAQGVAPGDRVALQAPKTPESVMLYLGALQLGAALLPLNTAYTSAETDYFRKDAEPRLFITDAVAAFAAAQGFAPDATIFPATPDTLAALLYTSGTTGRSKGAMLSHANLAANAQALVRAWGFTSEDVLLHALPIFHVHGLFIALHCALLTGSPMVWLTKFDADLALHHMRRATVMMGVPTFYTRLLDHPRLDRDAVAAMRLFVSGSAPLLESTFHAFEERTGHRILERYGMSEAAIITTNPLDGPRLPGSVGYALANTIVRIADGAETGVVEIKGPSVFSGYWRMPAKTAEDFTADGFFRTGDVGRLDPDGRLWLSGRAKDLIISGGYNIYPREVELVLDELPGVVESAVIGAPHPDFGEAVIAIVAGAGDEAALIAGAREKLAAFKTPKRIFFVEDLPRNAMGKVLKAQLRAQYQNHFVHNT